MSRLFAVVVLGLAGSLTAADFGGRWAGSATTADGKTAAMHLTLSQSTGGVSGQVIVGEAGEVPIDHAIARDNELRFTIRSNSGQTTEFTLMLTVTKNLLDESRVQLQGGATTAGRETSVILYPVSDNPASGTRFASPAVLLHKVEPQSTPEARQARVDGTVLLQVEIEETGLVSKERLQVLRSLGYGLDEAAMECVSQWRFNPAHKNGYAVKSTASIEVNFRNAEPRPR